MRTKWRRKKSRAFALLQNFLIPPSFKSLTIIPGWENYHSSNISFILRSFGIWMTIEWQNSHFAMTQNDRDGQGMRVIKIFSIKSFSPSSSFPCHSVISSNETAYVPRFLSTLYVGMMKEWQFTQKTWYGCCLIIYIYWISTRSKFSEWILILTSFQYIMHSKILEHIMLSH